MGKSPGLVVIGGDTCSEGREFESQDHLLHGHFFTLIFCKNCIVCLKRPKINKKVARVGAFLSYNWMHFKLSSKLQQKTLWFVFTFR